MDSYEVNKLIGGLLAAVFVVFSVNILSDSIFASPLPEKPGYAIESAGPEHDEGAAGEAVAEATPIATLLASASPEAGAAVFKKCAACHTIEQGGANKVGPNLWEVVDRPIATHEGFAYSAAMKEFSKGGAEKWSYDHLDRFLLAPKGYIKGTAMGFAGLKKDDERANVIAYLRTFSANPVALPEAAAAAPAAETVAAPAGEAPAAAPAGEAPAAEPASETPTPAGEAPDAATEIPASETPATDAPAPAEGTSAPETPAAAPAAPAPATEAPASAPQAPAAVDPAAETSVPAQAAPAAETPAAAPVAPAPAPEVPAPAIETQAPLPAPPPAPPPAQ